MKSIQSFCPLWGVWEAEMKLGAGSFGAVWKMRREDIDGKVYYAAVKHISIPYDESEIQHLLEEGIFSNEQSVGIYYKNILHSLTEEIEVMRTIQGYTNIVTYEDHLILTKKDSVGYDLFVRMELLTPLTSRMRQEMTTEDVVSLGKDIATAIDILNAHHLVHPDIKPQNIFVNDTGDYKLGDYGTARALETDATAMSRKGFHNYIAPEIYNGQKADIRVDIYSLGLVLYRLMNGNRLPFLPLTGDITSSQNEEAFLRRISGEKLPAPRYADEKLSRIILRACAYDPKARYHSGSELKKDLISYQENNSTAAQESEKKNGH